MLTYTLTLVYLDGVEKEIVLGKPHSLATSPAAALVYEDTDGKSHNVPLTALREFYFHPQNYNLCAETNSPQNLSLPTPGCDCSDCKRKVEKIKLAAVKL